MFYILDEPTFYEDFPVTTHGRPPNQKEFRDKYDICEKSMYRSIYDKWIYKQDQLRAEKITDHFKRRTVAPTESQVCVIVFILKHLSLKGKWVDRMRKFERERERERERSMERQRTR